MAKGRSVYIRAKKEGISKGVMWPEKKRMEALTTYLSCGSAAMTSAITNIPVDTIRVWKRSDWWKDAITELQYEENINISSKLSKILDKSLEVVSDRLENGDPMYDPRTGKTLRVPVKMRDAHKVTTDIVERKQHLLKMHVQQDLADKSQGQQVTADHLVQLAQAFAQFAQGQQPKPQDLANEVIEGEAKELFEDLGVDTKLSDNP